MSERRCFSKIIIDSDLFLDMPLSSQLLYFHLGMWADDEGFVNNPHKIQRSVGCSDDDLKMLEEKGFVIPFDSGVIVNKTKGHSYQGQAFPPFMQELIQAGGLVNYLNAGK